MASAVERLARVNARATRKFSEAATLNGRVVEGVYDEPYASDTFGQVTMGNSAPTFIVASTAVTDADRRQVLVLRGISYLVTNLEPDGAGDTLLRLEHT